MAACVIDASVALLWLLTDALTPKARMLRRYCVDHEVAMIAPPLFRPEVTSVIRRLLHTRRMTEPYASQALERSLRFPITITDAGPDLQRRAFEIAGVLHQSRAYDSQHVALAEFNRCDLWTADRRLVNGSQNRFPYVRWLGDYAE